MATREAQETPVTRATAKPWYREPWPWLLIAGPAAVVVAGAITIWLALQSNDGLVADDYYRKGLAINRELARDHEAARLGIHAQVRMTDSGAVEVEIIPLEIHPPVLRLGLVHPTRAGEDRFMTLVRVSPGLYRARNGNLPVGRRNVRLEDEAGTWRLGGEWTLPSERPLVLAPVGR